MSVSKTPLHRLFLGLLVAAVLIQTGMQLKKYLNHFTILSKSTEKASTILLPAVSFCPGFVPEEVLRHPWIRPGVFYDNTSSASFPASEEEAERFWRNVTFDVGDVLTDVIVETQGGHHVIHDRETLMDPDNGRCLWAEEVDALAGRCFVLHATCEQAERERLFLYFDLGRVYRGTLILFLHHPRASRGLNNDLWPSKASTAKVLARAETHVELAKEVRRSYSEYDEDGFYDCIDRVVANKMEEYAYSGLLCDFPPLRHALSALSAEHPKAAAALTHCQDEPSYSASYWNLVLALFSGGVGHDCPAPDGATTYSVSERRAFNPLLEGGAGEATVYFSSADASLEREQLLLDLPALTATVGGVVGMFLGWSLLDLAWVGAGWVEWAADKLRRS